MGCRVAASGHEEILDILRVQRPVGYACSASFVGMDTVVASDPVAFRMMNIGPPIRESDRVVVYDLVVIVPLVHDIITDEPATFSYAGDVV